MSRPTDTWRADGLRFSCTQCGRCCRVEGHVWVDRQEILALARHLGLTPDRFGRRFLRRVGPRVSLLEKANNDCIFWDDGCTVYAARPRQCRTFPFWDGHLSSPETWKAAGGECEGIGQGRLYSSSEIGSLSRGRGETSDDSGDDGDSPPTASVPADRR